MKLSIITINYNDRSGLQKTIESVISQTFRDFEWIVIDGGSTDGSRELIEQNADRFSYWVSEPDHGVYNAMNKGIKVARGEYLQFLNSGDWLFDETSLARCFSHPFTSDIVYGDFFFAYKDGKMEKSHFPSQLTLRYFYRRSLGHNASFIKRDLLLGDLYDERFRIVSDWAFFLKQALKNRSFEYIDEVVSCFDTDGISRTNPELVDQERETVLKELIPDMLVRDFRRIDELEAVLNNKHVKGVLKYDGKKRIYGKMMTGCLLLIEKLDKIIK